MTASRIRQRVDQLWPVWAAAMAKFLSRLVRTRLVGIEQTQGAPCGVAIWHGDELALIPRFGHLNPTVLVSRSKDGEIMARATQALGYSVTRGSSTRGAVGGMIALIKAVRKGATVVLTVDGPQGPRGVCKPGIVRIAQKTGVPLFPVGVAVSHRYVFKNTWNQVYLPLPFSRQVVYVAPPISFPETAGSGGIEGHCREVERALWEAHEKAATLLESTRSSVS
jgi:lysophospholipid acyltransferase (LPLAT)-like uncharacterized protein